MDTLKPPLASSPWLATSRWQRAVAAFTDWCRAPMLSDEDRYLAEARTLVDLEHRLLQLERRGLPPR